MKALKLTLALALGAALNLNAQSMHSMGATPAGVPPTSGQSAFATITEVVKALKADSTTDWSRVNIEALRQHLIDMDDVMMRAIVVPKDIPGGVELTVTGTGRTAEAVKRMLTSHVAALDDVPEFASSVKALANGVIMTVTAKNPSDAKTTTRIRGLGFAGLLTEGDHHALHHMMLARGEAMGHR